MEITFQSFLLGSVMTVAVFGAYWLGVFHNHVTGGKPREFISTFTRSLTRQGLIGSVTLPIFWVLLFYGLVVHIRISLGRWPEFGESLHGWFLSGHYQTMLFFAVVLIGSLYLAPIVLVVCLMIPRWRHISIYSVTYTATLGLALGSSFMAPHRFLNWFFD